MKPTSNLPRKIDPWPRQWDLHILNTCDFYFDKEDKKTLLDFINGASFSSCVVSIKSNEADISEQNTITGLEVRLLFRILESDYGAVLKYSGNNLVKGMVFYLVRTVIDINDINTELSPPGCHVIQSDHSLLLVQRIKGFKCKNAYSCISEIDNIIREDYGRRGKGDSDDSPIIDPPVSPDDSIILDPNLIAA